MVSVAEITLLHNGSAQWKFYRDVYYSWVDQGKIRAIVCSC